MKRYCLRGVCKSRVYTFKLAARIVGVSLATFRKWPKEGLKVITDKRPFLVRGADLIDFLNRRMAANRHIMTKDQIFCMRCKAPRTPLSGTLAFTPHGKLTGRISARCSECRGKIGRFCSTSEMEERGETLGIAIKASA